MSPTRRFVPLLIAGTAVIAAACSDAVAPTRPTTDSDLPTVASFGAPISFVRKANDRVESNAQTVSFKIFPNGGTARIGGYVLQYPAHAVCDPNRSGYGPTEWKKDCETLKNAITIRGKFWVDEAGNTIADFTPDIRFDPSKNVYLATVIPKIVGQTWSEELQAQYRIGFTTREGNTRYFLDDAATDPALVTILEQVGGVANGWAKRRVYHFSGYFVREGIWCEDGSDDPFCLIEAP